MAITADFYTFAKRKNSTKIPSSQPTTYNITLKDDCSITNPVIGLDIGIANNPHNYNYCKITTFGRWYYVSDWVWSGRLWWATLAVDVLATYKTDILNNSDYIVRAGTGYDGKIMDTMYPCKNERAVANYSLLPSNLWVNNYNDGCYVVGIINNDDISIGAVSYYAMLPGQFADLKNALMTDTSWTDISVTNPDLGDSLYRSIFNPYQYFVSVNWFPFVPATSNMTFVTTLNVGWWTLNVSAYRLTNTSLIYRPMDTTNNRLPNITIYDHPQWSDRGDFVRGNPYTTYRLYIPPWGEFTLDGSILAAANWTTTGSSIWPRQHLLIYCDISVDMVSGIGTLRVYTNSANPAATPIQIETILLQTETMVAVPIQLAQISTSAMGQLYHVASGVGADLLNWLGMSDITSAATAIADAASGATPHVQSIGSNGSISQYTSLQRKLQCEYAVIVNDAISDKGRPVCKYDQLGNYSGYYVQTSGAHVDIAGYEDEINEINTALDGGVYLE